MIEDSYHNKITSISCLKKVIDTVEMQCGKSFTNVVLRSAGMGAQFRSRFIFKLLAGTMFLNKSLCWFYNKRHHEKVPMYHVGGTIKKVIFWKVLWYCARLWSIDPNNFLMLPWNLCHLLLLCTCLNRMK